MSLPDMPWAQIEEIISLRVGNRAAAFSAIEKVSVLLHHGNDAAAEMDLERDDMEMWQDLKGAKTGMPAKASGGAKEAGVPGGSAGTTQRAAPPTLPQWSAPLREVLRQEAAGPLHQPPRAQKFR